MNLTIPQEKALLAISKIQLNKTQKTTVDNFISIAENEGINSGAALFFIKTIEDNRSQVVNPDMHILSLRNSVEYKITGVSVGMSQVYFMVMVSALEEKPIEVLLSDANNYFGCDLKQKTRVVNYVNGRQMLMKRLFNSGYGVVEISRLLNKDHATIIWGIKSISEKIEKVPKIKDKWMHYISI